LLEQPERIYTVLNKEQNLSKIKKGSKTEEDGLLTVPEQLRWLEHLAGTSLSSQQTSHCTPAHDALHGRQNT
jgi:hypothetical protein